MAGYIKLHRKVMGSAVWPDDWLFKLWTWCLLRANYAPQQFYEHTISAGQFVTSTESGAEQLHVSRSKFWRGLQRLASPAIGQITLQAKHKYTIVTVCNWEAYQNAPDEDETPAKRQRNGSETEVKRQRNANETPAEPIEERKKEKKERKKEGGVVVSVAIPEALDTPEFATAWADWQTHRKEIKHPLTATQATTLLKKFERLGASRAIEAIEHTIAMGWRGIREPDGEFKPDMASRVPTAEDDANWSAYGGDS